MIVVHHLNNSRSQRVLWLLEELGLPYRVERYQRDANTALAPPELFRIHPLGKSPVIEHAGQVVAESGAIIEYLLEQSDDTRLRPAPGTPEALQFRYWLHFAEGSAMQPLLLKLVFERIESGAPWLIRPVASGIARRMRGLLIEPNLSRQLDFMEQTLAAQTWFAGAQFSAADIQMSFPLEASASRGGLDSRYPKLSEFLQRIHARDAYQRALRAGGPYTIV